MNILKLLTDVTAALPASPGIPAPIALLRPAKVREGVGGGSNSTAFGRKPARKRTYHKREIGKGISPIPAFTNISQKRGLPAFSRYLTTDELSTNSAVFPTDIGWMSR